MANPTTTSERRSETRELTGRAVLLWFAALFGIVFAVNGAMVHFATTTFGGVETSSSYKAGLAFKQDIEAAKQQDALDWQVAGSLTHTPAGEVTLELAVRDRAGKAIQGWSAAARLSHPVDARQDHPFTMRRTGPETARGIAHAGAGQWNVIVELERDGIRIFRSRSRIVMR